MGYLERVRQSSNVSRRGFVKAAAAATAALSVVGFAGCGPNDVEKQSENVSGDGRDITTGEWKSASCWHNCGGRCVNKVLVRDGVVIRQKTDDTHEDSYEYPQIRGCGRGRSQRQQVFGANRLKYPMKRKHWEPLTGGQKELRGVDEWERISWDEALDYVVAEIKYVTETYGPRAIYCPGGDEIFNTLALNGGYTYSWCTSSTGSWNWLHNYGFEFIGVNGNDRFDLINCDYVVMVGCNPAWSSAGNPSWYYKQLRDSGVKFLAIDPFYNDSYDMLDASWIPVYPGSDTSFLIGVAYAMIEQDEEKHLIDWEFLSKYVQGFDASTLPEGANPEENFKDYVLGTFDGLPKTPEWASEHCGASPEQIRELATIMGKDNKVALIGAFAPSRTINGEYFPILFMTVGMMGGHLGKSGHCVTTSSNSWGANSRTPLVMAGDAGLPPVPNHVDDKVNDLNVWESMLKGEYLYTGMHFAPLPGETRDLNIHLIYHGGLNGHSNGIEVASIQTKPNINKGIEAHRMVDFVVTHAYTFTPDAKYSDIVLPVATRWERAPYLDCPQKEAIMAYSQICEPLYEAKSDQWIAEQIAERLGLDPKAAFPISETQQYFNQLAGSLVMKADGSGFEPVATITQEDIDAWGVEGTPQEGRIPLQEWIDRGIFQVERKADDVFTKDIAFAKYLEDPVANPRLTASGKLEIYCPSVRDQFAMTTYDNGVASAIPVWTPVLEGHEGTYSNWETKEKGQYPFQVFNPHYLRRSHSTFDNIGWLRKAWSHPVFINAQDAEAKGIVEGDTVLIWNDNGKTLRPACVTNRIMPGVLALPHGGWVDIDEETGIDRGGADNILCGSKHSVAGITGWNTCLVDFEKYDGEPLVPDCEKPQTVLF